MLAFLSVFGLSLAFLLTFGLLVYLRWHFTYWKVRNVAGPPPKLLTGTLPKSAAGQCNLMEELHEIYLAYKQSHKFVGIFTARSPKLFILEPKLANETLTTHFRHFRDNESSQWTNAKVEQLRLCSPFVSTGDAWKEKRLELAGALTANRLRSSFPAMLDSAKELLTYLQTQTNVALDAKELANRFTAQLMSNFIWGIEANAFADTQQQSAIHRMADCMLRQALKCVKYYGKTAAWPWLRKLRPMRFFPAISDNFFHYLTLESMKMRMRDEESKSNERSDVLNHLLQLKFKKGLADMQLVGHATTMLIDGFETAAIVIAHCLLLLSRDHRIQQKLRTELLAFKDELSFDALNELPYLDQCLQETLRLFPPLPTLFKLCTSPLTLENTDGSSLTLNTNDVVYISSYSFQRDGDYYAQPETFWPERFDEELGGVKRYQEMGIFLPFGDGPRICPGMRLGLVEAKLGVASIVRHFSFSCTKDTRQDNKIAADSFLLCLEGGIRLIFNELPDEK